MTYIIDPNLNTTVGKGFPSSEEYIKNIRARFERIGYPAGNPDFRYMDRPLEDAIRKFQRDHDLKIDGIMHPRGETDSALSLKIAEKERALKPEHKPSDPKNVPPKRKPYDTQTDAINPWYPEVDILAAGVGKGAKIAIGTGAFIKDMFIEHGAKQIFKKIVDKVKNKDNNDGVE